jgi:hypothetical protein
MDVIDRAPEDRDRTPIELVRDYTTLRNELQKSPKISSDGSRAAEFPDSFPHVIFFDGVDGAGKTTRIKKLLQLDFPFKYFRSSYQIHSKFANRKVDLEGSIEHDWRILYDFIRQAGDQRTIYLIDRGFLSSYVYSKVLRNKNIYRYVRKYIEMFAPFSEFWIFAREDSGMTDAEPQINNEFYRLFLHLNEQFSNFRLFKRMNEGKFITDSFLEYDEQVRFWGFDRDYYKSRLESLNIKSYDMCVISDLDGTIFNPGYPQNDTRDIHIENVTTIKSHNPDVILVVTGRPNLDSELKEQVRNAFSRTRVEFVCNSRNLGLSSRILKGFVANYMNRFHQCYIFFDDRKDVMDYLFGDGVKSTNSIYEYNPYRL